MKLKTAALVCATCALLTNNTTAINAQRAGDAAQSSQANASSSLPKLPRVPVERFTLKNGLRVVLSPDNAVPVVSVAIYYSVGSRNERAGRSGFAHLFEHMLFQGSDNVPKGAYFSYVQNAGGTLNGTTSTERTNYFVTLPANQLPLALWLESDRLRSLKVTQENLDNQREVVKEEKRLRIDNQPYATSQLRMSELMYRNPSNAHSTIGSMDDLNAANLADVQDFFKTYYAPNNAVLSIAGDFDTKEARRLIEQYFATIPRQEKPFPAIDVNEPAEVAVRQETLRDSFAQLPAFRMGWKIPARRTPDFYALRLASELLTDGESSRLYQRLVKGDELALSVGSGIDERRGPSGFLMFGIPKPGVEATRVRAVIDEEIKRLATVAPSADEMQKLRNNLVDTGVRRLQTSLARATQLAEFELYDGDANLINSELENYLRVTPEQIQAAVAKYLNTDNRSVLDIVPAPRGAGNAPAAPQRADRPAQPGAPPPTVPAPSPSPVAPTRQPVAPEQQGTNPTPTQPEQPQQPNQTPATPARKP